jgi:hypothetical protein
MAVRIIFISAMPKDHDYLDQVNSEFRDITINVFNGLDIGQHEYVTQELQFIDKDTITDIFRFEPDIIHFSGHGSNKGLVFQDGESIPANWLTKLFEDKKEIQLLFLNACYSADQISELKNSGKIKYIIGNEGEISEYSATEFAFIFYKNYKITKNIPQAFVNAQNEYKIKNDRQANTKQVFYPEEEILELISSDQPIEKMKNDNNVRVVQSKKIPNDTLNKIDDAIKAFEEDIMSSQDPVRFKDEMKDVSDILSTLKVHAL